MTNEEAINVFRGFKFTQREMKAVALGMEALEKQIPKKPIITKFVYGAELINCGQCYRCTHITRAIDYCPHCGTKIDWGEGESK